MEIRDYEVGRRMEVVETRALGRFGHYPSIILAVFMILAVVFGGISLWLCLLGFELNFQNIMFTATLKNFPFHYPTLRDSLDGQGVKHEKKSCQNLWTGPDLLLCL